ncbi:hypothetical protein BGX29_002606 [Mortierella sp. GBA35]|nr:hypothetical protein BGX29_002606 [Mortierella sp. GBA35]
MDSTAPRLILGNKTQQTPREQDLNNTQEDTSGASHIVNGASTNTSTGIAQQPPHRHSTTTTKTPPTSTSTSTTNGSGLSLRERQQLANSNSSVNGSNGSLTLSITPPKPTYLSVDPQQQRQQHLNGDGGSLSESQESLGSNLSLGQGQGQGGPMRRGSFNLSTGSLTFTPGSSSSLASPSSPSYSTIAVARARAAAAAAAAGGQGQRANNNTAFDTTGYGDLSESGVFPGVQSSIPYPAGVQAVSGEGRQQIGAGATLYYSNSPHPPLSDALSSSNSSLLSNGSASSFQSGSGGSSSNLSSANGGASLPLTHLQDNAKAEREVSMIMPDFLYLGGELVEEAQLEELEQLGIRRVLNMAVNCDDELWIERFGRSGYLKVGLRDHVDQDLKDGLDEAIKFIGSSKTPIYVHCQAGKSRSVATVIGYLIQEHRWPLKRAYDHVVERRRCMSPNIGFVSQLILLEKRVLGSDKANGLVSVAAESEDLNPASRTTVIPWMAS